MTKLTIQILLPHWNVNLLHSVLIIWNHGLIYRIIWLCMHNSGCFISDVSFELRDWSLIARAIDKGWKEVPVRLSPVNIYFHFFIFVYFSAYIKHTGGFNHKSMQTLLGSSPQTKNCQIRELTHNTQGVTLCNRRFCSASQMDAYHNRDTIFCQKFWNHDHACQKIVDL